MNISCLLALLNVELVAGTLFWADGDAHGVGHVDVVVGVGEHAGVGVDCKHLDGVCVTAGTKQEASVGRYGKIAWMPRCGLVARACERPAFFIHAEDGYTVALQTV